MPPHTHILTLLSLLVQTPTYALSNDICSAFDKSLSPPILSVFHYPPTASIVFLLKGNRIQSVPVARLNVAERTLSLEDSHPRPIAADPELRCCSEPPLIYYQHMEIYPEKCDDSDEQLKIHYKVKLKQSSDTKPTFLERDIYMDRSLDGTKTMIATVDQPNDNPPTITEVYCRPGRRCSLITDPVKCDGYHFSLIDGQKTVILQELSWRARIWNGPDFATYALQTGNRTHFKLALDSNSEDLFSEELPLGFILNQTVVLFSLRSAKVYLLRYVPLPATFRMFDLVEEVPIIGRTNLAKFFKCPGFQNSADDDDDPTEVPDSQLTLQLSLSLIAVIAVLAILIALCLVVGRSSPVDHLSRRLGRHQIMPISAVLIRKRPTPGRVREKEGTTTTATTTTSQQLSSDSQIKGKSKGKADDREGKKHSGKEDLKKLENVGKLKTTSSSSIHNVTSSSDSRKRRKRDLILC